MKQVAGKAVERALAGSRAVICLDGGGAVAGSSEAARELLGLPGSGIEGRRLSAWVQAVDAFGNRVCTGFCGLREMAERGQAIRTFPLELAPVAGSEFRRFVVQVDIVGESDEKGPFLLLSLRPDRRRRVASARQAGPPEDRDTRQVDLTRRQTEILGRLARGQSAREIAAELAISINTVRKHIQASLRKLGAQSQAHAIAVAVRRDLI